MGENGRRAVVEQFGRERLVVAVTDAEDETVIAVAQRDLGLDFGQTEVTLTLVTEGVGLLDDPVAGGAEAGLDFLQQLDVRDRNVGLGRIRRVGLDDVDVLGAMGTAMEGEVELLGGLDRGFEEECVVEGVKGAID